MIDSKKYAEEHSDELKQLLRELCGITAPSNDEGRRAEFCLEWFKRHGAKEAYIDSANNVILPVGCEESDRITVIAAHTDTVFSDVEPMPMREEGGRLYCPGVGDDTASLAVLMLTALAVMEQGAPEGGILFVSNSGEEGLGNLRGVRQLFTDYEGKIARFYSMDATFFSVCDRSVGSHRYKLTIKTEGGHSFANFGNTSAIQLASEVVQGIYSIEVPQIDGARTTYNVGSISGGTSVNTIAEEAELLCEYRSESREALEFMKSKFEEIFETCAKKAKSLKVELVGDRPCDAHKADPSQELLVERISNTIADVMGKSHSRSAGSTDCNLPRSLGIPSVCFGVYNGAGAHTRDEWVELSTLAKGLEISLRVALYTYD